MNDRNARDYSNAKVMTLADRVVDLDLLHNMEYGGAEEAVLLVEGAVR